MQTALLRPHSSIHAFAPDDATCRKVKLARGVVTRQVSFDGGPDVVLKRSIEMLISDKVVEKGTPLVVISDMVQEGRVVDSVLLIHA